MKRALTRSWLLVCKLHSDESGSEIVEFAVSSVLLFTVIFGIFAVCQTLYSDHYVAYMAREATRYALVRGSTFQGTACASSTTFNCAAAATDITAFVISVTPPGFQASNLTVSTTWPGTTPLGAGCASASGTNSPGCLVVVKVTYAYNYTIPFVPAVTVPLTSTSSMAISQ
jgi:Flp pilus assembly protein TadG